MLDMWEKILRVVGWRGWESAEDPTEAADTDLRQHQPCGAGKFSSRSWEPWRMGGGQGQSAHARLGFAGG